MKQAKDIHSPSCSNPIRHAHEDVVSDMVEYLFTMLYTFRSSENNQPGPPAKNPKTARLQDCKTDTVARERGTFTRALKKRAAPAALSRSCGYTVRVFPQCSARALHAMGSLPGCILPIPFFSSVRIDVRTLVLMSNEVANSVSCSFRAASRSSAYLRGAVTKTKTSAVPIDPTGSVRVSVCMRDGEGSTKR